MTVLRMLGDMFKAIVLLAFTTKSLAVIHWLILASSVSSVRKIFERAGGGRNFRKFEINEHQNEKFPAQNQVRFPAQN